MRPVRFCALFLAFGGLCVAVFPAAAPAQVSRSVPTLDLVGDSIAEGFRPSSSRPVAKVPIVKIGTPYKADYSKVDYSRAERRPRRLASAKGVRTAKGHKDMRK